MEFIADSIQHFKNAFNYQMRQYLAIFIDKAFEAAKPSETLNVEQVVPPRTVTFSAFELNSTPS